MATAQSVTRKWVELSPDIWRARFTWTCTDLGVVSEAFTAEEKARVFGMYLFLIVTNPSATAPTTLYDITLVDDEDLDIAGGVLANRSATVTEQEVPKLGSTVYGDRIVDGGLTVTIAAAGDAKIGDVILYFRR